MSFGVTILVASALSAAVVVLLRVVPSDARRKARKMLREASVLTPSTADGELVRVTGVVEAPELPLCSPLQDTKCVAYRLEVIARPAGSYHAVERSLPFVVDCGAAGRFL